MRPANGCRLRACITSGKMPDREIDCRLLATGPTKPKTISCPNSPRFAFDALTLKPKNAAMKSLMALVAGVALQTAVAAASEVHVWEKVELTFHAQNPSANPYMNVEVWVDLKGPGFDKRCYGFWDGGDVFRVRILATAPGEWSWRSGSNQKDSGLNDQRGSFTAIAWSDADKTNNPLRRGFIQPTENGHAFEYADGTPFILLGDTWYAAATSRFKWNDDEQERSIGPDAGFKDFLRLRKGQGFNSVLILAAFPNWANDDGQPWEIWLDQKADLGVRSSWVDQGDI